MQPKTMSDATGPKWTTGYSFKYEFQQVPKTMFNISPYCFPSVSKQDGTTWMHSAIALAQYST